MAHLTDADGTPILLYDLDDQGVCAGCAKPLIPGSLAHPNESCSPVILMSANEPNIIRPAITKNIKDDLHELSG